jgi:hypothetical protein
MAAESHRTCAQADVLLDLLELLSRDADAIVKRQRASQLLIGDAQPIDSDLWKNLAQFQPDSVSEIGGRPLRNQARRSAIAEALTKIRDAKPQGLLDRTATRMIVPPC